MYQHLKTVIYGLLVFVSIFLNTETREVTWSGWDDNLEWWQTSIIYQIYPRSFQDSDGDGIGDLKGIQSRLDHLADIGVECIWLSPIFKSPMADLGYDISNYTDVDPIFGTLDDFKDLLADIKKRGMYLMMDFVPNHSSDQHEWFQKSIKKIDPYTDYYVWKDGVVYEDGTIAAYPNNWLSLFGGSAWTYVKERGQFYFHQFNAKQPDLNTYNEKVQNDLKKIMEFWLDLGVDGFRMDAVKHLREDPLFRNEELAVPHCNTTYYCKLNHTYTTDWPATYDLIYDWRQFLDNYTKHSENKSPRVMFTEAYTDVGYVMQYYGNASHVGAQVSFNFLAIYMLTYQANSSVYDKTVQTWYNNLPNGKWPNWVTGNHDNHRVATRVGTEMVDAFFMLSMLLPGTAITYQGEELGQPDTLIRDDQVRDPNNNGGGLLDVRDFERGPFLWDASENAGFTDNIKPWEPIHPSYWEINLKTQKAQNHSHYKIYKQISTLHKTNTIQRGNLLLHNISNWVFCFSRNLEGDDSYAVVINAGSEREIVMLGDAIPNLPNMLEIVVSSINSGYTDGDLVSRNIMTHAITKPLVLRPKASVVLRFKRKHHKVVTKEPTTTQPKTSETENAMTSDTSSVNPVTSQTSTTPSTGNSIYVISNSIISCLMLFLFTMLF